jgi:hypothetical protein
LINKIIRGDGSISADAALGLPIKSLRLPFKFIAYPYLKVP